MDNIAEGGGAAQQLHLGPVIVTRHGPSKSSESVHPLPHSVTQSGPACLLSYLLHFGMSFFTDQAADRR